MKSNTWLISASAVLGAVALLSYGCAKDTESKEPSESKNAQKKSAKLVLKPNLPPPKPPNASATLKGPKSPVSPAKAGAKAKDKAYNLKLDAPKTAGQGAESVVRVTVTPNEGWKMNDEFPTRLKVTAPDGVTLGKAKQVLADAEKFAEKELTFAIKFTPSSAGKKSFAADFRFAVCTDTTCDPKQEKLAWDVTVQ